MVYVLLLVRLARYNTNKNGGLKIDSSAAMDVTDNLGAVASGVTRQGIDLCGTVGDTTDSRAPLIARENNRYLTDSSRPLLPAVRRTMRLTQQAKLTAYLSCSGLPFAGASWR